MAIALVLEDGTSKSNSNTYVTEEEFLAYAEGMGFEIATPADVVPALLKGSQYLDLVPRADYQGSKTVATQAMQWPRRGVTIDCVAFLDNAIPRELKVAQMELALIALQDDFLELFKNSDGYPVYRVKVDVIEEQYMTPRQLSTRPDGSIQQPQYPKVDALLFPLLKGNECPGGGSSGWAHLRVLRM
ncbi:hypothetical protein AMA2_61 [Achromobacter phage AMA2]|nr:hypothetical protein AMA2_61 [Achromobacter phage AMA2]